MKTIAAPAEKKFRDLPTLTTTQVEGALCAWEWMIEESNKAGSEIEGYFEGLGSVAMRWCSMQAGFIACQVHDHMRTRGYEFADCYDWRFVPAVLQKLNWRALTEDNQYSGAPYNPDIHAIFCDMVAADKAEHTDPNRRSFHKPEPAPDVQSFTPADYITACRTEADKQWGYGDLVSDHPEKVTNAMEAAEDPATFIQWLGEKYDLTPVTHMQVAS